MDSGAQQFVLNRQDTRGEVLGGVPGQDRYCLLGDDRDFVVVCRHLVDCCAGHGVTAGKHGLVHEPAVHTGSAVAWQERGVDVDNAALVLAEHCGADLFHVPSGHD